MLLIQTSLLDYSWLVLFELLALLLVNKNIYIFG
jgi:hypothetical protein